MSILDEFKEFAMRGNVVDLAVGIVIGGAFRKIVDSLVNDIVMPPIGLILARVDFDNLFWTLSAGEYETLAQAEEAGAATINYGRFLNNVVDFLIVAVVIFLAIRWINSLQREIPEPEPEAPSTKACPFCLATIPIQATRCPQCTSHLEGSADGAEQQ